jgi:hypothetical protein
MPVRHRFVYRWPPGVDPVTFDAWIQNLNAEEKTEFFSARQRQISYRTQAIEQRLMDIDNGTYVWKDQEAAVQNKPTDETWYRYFKRYLDETGTIFDIEEEKC